MDRQKRINLAKAKLEAEAKKTERTNQVAKKLIAEQAELKQDFKTLQEGILEKLVELREADKSHSKALNDAIRSISINEDLVSLTTTLKSLEDTIASGVKLKNPPKDPEPVDLSKIKPPIVNVPKFELPKGLATDDTAKKVVSALKQIEDKLKPPQAPSNFTPYRRVVKQGDKFVFDDNLTGSGSRGGGGGSSGGDASSAKQDEIITALQNRYGGGKTPVPFTVTASGDTTIHTPASGKAVRLFSISAATDPDQSTTPLIKVLIGSTEKTRGHVISGWEIREGAADEVLKINLSELSSVSGTAYITEFTP